MSENNNKADETKQASIINDDFIDLKSFINMKKAQNKALKKLFDKLYIEQDQTNNN